MGEDEDLEKVLERLAILRHAEQISGNVTETCRVYGISRATYYRWLHRYNEFGQAGLRDVKPGGTVGVPVDPEVLEHIIDLRDKEHRGPRQIARLVERDLGVRLTPSEVWAVLRGR